MWYNVVRTKDVLWWIYLWPLFSIDFALYTVALLCIALHCSVFSQQSDLYFTVHDTLTHLLTHWFDDLMVLHFVVYICRYI